MLPGHRPLVGESPQTAHALTSQGHDHLVGMFAACDQVSGALAPPDVGLPAAVLEDVRWLCQSPLEMPTHLGGVALRPGACNESATGLRVAGFGHRPRAAALPRGRFRGAQAQAFHECSGGIKAGEVAECGHGSDRHGARHPAPGLQGCDDRVEAPGGDRRVECLVETWQAFRGCGDRAAIGWKDAWWRRGRAAHRREPPELGRAPGGPARVAESLPESEGVEPARGGRESAAGIVTGPAEVTESFLCPRGPRDRGEST